MNYTDYLRTDHWKTTRTEAISRAGNQCQICSARSGLEVHHNNYLNLWNETNQDLIVLCHDCHNRHHQALNKIEPADIQPPTIARDRTPRAITEADFRAIKDLWIQENRIVLDAQAGKITESQRAEAIADIRAQIEEIRYED